MNRRDKILIKACDLVLKLATDQTRARVLVGLYQARGLLVSESLLKRANFPQERYP